MDEEQSEPMVSVPEALWECVGEIEVAYLKSIRLSPQGWTIEDRLIGHRLGPDGRWHTGGPCYYPTLLDAWAAWRRWQGTEEAGNG